MNDPSRVPARRFRPWLSLRVLMLLVLVLGGGSGWIVHRAHVQRDAVEAIRRAKGFAYYDWHYSSGKLDPNASPPGPKWLRDLVGPDMFNPVVAVMLRGGTTDDHVLSRVGDLSSLERLFLHGGPSPGITPAGLSQIGRLSRLEEIVVAGEEDSRGFLTQLWDKSRLRCIQLGDTALTDADLARLARLTRLEELRFNGRHVTNAGFAHLAKLKQLQAILLTDCRVSDLTPMDGLKNLQRLGLVNNDRPLVEGPPVDLAPLRGLAKLEYLLISGMPIDDAGLAQIKGLAWVRSLEVGGEGITQAGLADVAGMPKLSYLGLRKVAIHDLTPLSPLLPRLKALRLAESPLVDDTLRMLAGATGLTVLYLTDTAVTDDGLELLAGLKNLLVLDLSGTQVSDEGLAQLARVPKLKELVLRGTPVSEAAIVALKKASPRLKTSRQDRLNLR